MFPEFRHTSRECKALVLPVLLHFISTLGANLLFRSPTNFTLVRITTTKVQLLLSLLSRALLTRMHSLDVWVVDQISR